MFRPMACVWFLKMRPRQFLASAKYSSGLTRTSAPVGQFSWHEYARPFAPSGLSGVFSHRLHLTASRSSVPVAEGGIGGGARLNHRLRAPPERPCGGGVGPRGTIEMAL